MKVAERVSEADVITWQMASHKMPRAIAFVETLPKSLAGKLLWLDLDAPHGRTAARADCIERRHGFAGNCARVANEHIERPSRDTMKRINASMPWQRVRSTSTASAVAPAPAGEHRPA